MTDILHFYRIKKDIFIKAASEIVLAYPDEREGIYFVSGKPKTKTTTKSVNKGKLWSRYCNVKNKLGGVAKNNAANNDIEEEIQGIPI